MTNHHEKINRQTLKNDHRQNILSTQLKKKNLVNGTNVVHNFFLICLLLFSTCFGQLCVHHQENLPYICDTWYLLLYMDDCLVCRAE